MYNSDTDLIFPVRVLPSLRGLRGREWDRLIDQALQSHETALDRLAFILMMVRLNGCVSCDADAYRALHGCTQCSRQAIQRFRGPEQELLGLHDSARNELDRYLREKTS